MADLTGCPSLMLLLRTYREYSATTEKDTFRARYAAILRPYQIETENSATAVGLQEVTRKIYAATQ